MDMAVSGKLEGVRAKKRISASEMTRQIGESSSTRHYCMGELLSSAELLKPIRELGAPGGSNRQQ